MKQVNAASNLTSKVIFAFAILLLIVGSIAVVSTLKYFKLKEQLRYTQGCSLDLPEEISALKDSIQPLQGYRRNNIIHIEFPNQ